MGILTSNPLRRRLTLVKRYHSTNQPNTQTRKESPSDEHRLCSRSRLENDTQVEDDARRGHESKATAKEIGCWAVETYRQHRSRVVMVIGRTQRTKPQRKSPPTKSTQ